MIKKQSRAEVRVKKHMKIRNRFSGTAERPRLAVFRSNNHMYAQKFRVGWQRQIMLRQLPSLVK